MLISTGLKFRVLQITLLIVRHIFFVNLIGLYFWIYLGLFSEGVTKQIFELGLFFHFGYNTILI